MKFNMICIKFDQKTKKTFKKPKFWTFEVFYFFKPKKPRFFSKPFSSRELAQIGGTVGETGEHWDLVSNGTIVIREPS